MDDDLACSHCHLDASARAELRKRELTLACLEAAFHASPLPIQLFAPDGTSLVMNRAQARFLGFSDPAAAPPAFNILRSEPAAVSGHLERYRRAFAGEVVQESDVFVDLDGEPGVPHGSSGNRWLDQVLVPIKAPQGDVSAVVSIAWDATERHRLNEEVTRLWEGSTELLAVIDRAGRIIRANPAWSRATGYSEAELVGRRAADFVHPDDAATAMVIALHRFEGSPVERVRARFICKDGSIRTLSWSVSAPDREGKSHCVVRDVTERVRVELEMEELLEALRSSSAVLIEQARELDELRAQAEWRASRDPLTGLLSRGAWFEAAADDDVTSLLLLDIDFFKQVNDSYGHPAGDAVLCQVAERLTSAIGANGVTGRVGGEEFAIAITLPVSEARMLGARLVQAVAESPFYLVGIGELPVTISAGFSPRISPTAGLRESVSDTYSRADTLLYNAKTRGRNQLSA